eukprot:TRINITY_DN22906_c0_g1_i3.p1 TRINITY_DN22906_c0_g1~~TRINITY_DN22906_c0_g1_i3.p1  ORF type:complete len:164 (+),score=23.33 TRINITY_DN22906_c0_g1_i3:147-638(+)
MGAQKYQREPVEARPDLASELYSNYLAPSAPHYVQLDSKIQDDVYTHVTARDFSPELFQKAYQAVYSDISQEHFRKFLISTEYQSWNSKKLKAARKGSILGSLLSKAGKGASQLSRLMQVKEDDEKQVVVLTEEDEKRIAKQKEIGRAVQQECRDRSRMPSSA